MEKIAFVCRSLTESSNLSYLFKIFEYFLKKGYEINLYAQEVEKDKLNKNVNLILLPKFFNNYLFNEVTIPFQTLKAVKRKNHDLIYSHSSRYLFADIMGVHFLFGVESAKNNSLILKIGEKISFYPKSKKILTVSKFMKKLLKKFYGISPSRIKVIHYGVDTKRFSKKLRKKEKTKRIKEEIDENGKPLIIYVGGRPFRKGLPYLLEAMKVVEDSKLIVTGLTPSDENYFKNLSKALKIEDKVYFTGFLSHDELKYFYAASDIFVLPTLFDPFGLVVLEAMACGSAPVVSKYAGASELITHGKNGMIIENPKISEKIAECINSLLEDFRLLKKIQRNAIKTAEKRDWKNVAKEWEEYFREVYENKTRNR